MENVDAIELQPIGRVSNSVKEIRPMKDTWRDIVSDITLDTKHVEGLYKLGEFSHIVVVYWMHEVAPEKRVAGKVRIQGDGPEVGTLALRTPNRPNPVGVSTVRLEGIQENVLRVIGLDAVDGTPVLDIKPYSLRHDVAESPRLPEWALTLW